MVSALILVNCNIGAAKAVANELRKIKGVIEVYETFGVYDLVVKITTADQIELGESVRTMQAVEGVHLVLTNVVYKKELAADTA